MQSLHCSLATSRKKKNEHKKRRKSRAHIMQINILHLHTWSVKRKCICSYFICQQKKNKEEEEKMAHTKKIWMENSQLLSFFSPPSFFPIRFQVNCWKICSNSLTLQTAKFREPLQRFFMLGWKIYKTYSKIIIFHFKRMALVVQAKKKRVQFGEWKEQRKEENNNGESS